MGQGPLAAFIPSPLDLTSVSEPGLLLWVPYKGQGDPSFLAPAHLTSPPPSSPRHVSLQCLKVSCPVGFRNPGPETSWSKGRVTGGT